MRHCQLISAANQDTHACPGVTPLRMLRCNAHKGVQNYRRGPVEPGQSVLRLVTGGGVRRKPPGWACLCRCRFSSLLCCGLRIFLLSQPARRWPMLPSSQKDCECSARSMFARQRGAGVLFCGNRDSV